MSFSNFTAFKCNEPYCYFYTRRSATIFQEKNQFYTFAAKGIELYPRMLLVPHLRMKVLSELLQFSSLILSPT